MTRRSAPEFGHLTSLQHILPKFEMGVNLGEQGEMGAVQSKNSPFPSLEK